MKDLILDVNNSSDKMFITHTSHLQNILEDAIVIAKEVDSNNLFYFVESNGDDYILYTLGHIQVDVISYEELKTNYRLKIQMIDDIFKNKD